MPKNLLQRIPQEVKNMIAKQLSVIERARVTLAAPHFQFHPPLTDTQEEVQHARVWCSIIKPRSWSEDIWSLLKEEYGSFHDLVVLGSDLEFLYNAEKIPPEYGPLHLY
ncbi:uncharacterized protein F5Z01DRAFT_602318, partial [Emericellopsis atlantica]